MHVQGKDQLETKTLDGWVSTDAYTFRLSLLLVHSSINKMKKELNSYFVLFLFFFEERIVTWADPDVWTCWVSPSKSATNSVHPLGARPLVT